MFIGHYAAALAAKRMAPKTSLGTLVLGATFLDLLFPMLVMAGMEHLRIVKGITVMMPLDLYDYPLSHSLAACLLYAALAGGIYFAVKRYMPGALAIALCVLSHWILDLISHRPDLPLYPGSGTTLGLGLWNFPAGSIIVEAGLFVAGVWLYAGSTKAADRIGRYAFWGLAAFLSALYVLDMFSPPPPDIQPFAWVGLSGWLLVLWAAWADRHRTARELPPT
jgi:hypothetical protein